MKPSAPLALALLAATAFAHIEAQSQATFTDPANLRGERPAPRTGRELPIDQGPLGLQQLLRKLNTRASIMNIVAHPDDEDGGMMALYSRGLGARVADLSLTRGEGGQNAVTADFEDALGLLRTQELLSCDRYSGVDQFFGTEVDFGFSKTKEEAFAKWTHERVLYDAVRAIRLYRPLVITSTWVGGVTDGHGQHQVSGQIAQEAFVAAGDPKVFPELTAEGILPWQPLRIYARAPMQSISEKGLFDYATGQYTPAKFTNYVTGEVTATPPSIDVIVHEGAQDPLLTQAAANSSDIPSKASLDPDTPFTYVQFARIGLGLQRSQVGPDARTAPSGAFDVAYHLYGSRVADLQRKEAPTARPIPAQGKALGSSQHKTQRAEGPTYNPSTESNFFDGIDTSIEGIATLAPDASNTIHEGLAKLSSDIAAATSQFDSAKPSAIAPVLAEALNQDDVLISLVDAATLAHPEEKASILHELRTKRVQLNDALALSFGLSFDATTTGADQVAGSATVVLTQLRSTTPATRFTIENEWLQMASAPPIQPQRMSDRDSGEDQRRWASSMNTGRPDAPGHKEFPDLTSEHPVLRSLHATARDTANITRPYFVRDSLETPVYKLLNADLRDAPSRPPALTAWVALDYRGVQIQLAHVVHDGPQPLNFVPTYALALSSHAQVVPLSDHKVTIAASLTAASEPQKPLTLPVTLSSSTLHPQTEKVAVPGHADFHVELPAIATTLAAAAIENDHRFTEGYRPIGYGDFPRTNYYTPATTRIVPVDLKLPTRHNIAYLPGTGDSIPEALTSIGLTPTILTVADLTPDHLKPFDTVILGVRTYSAHPDLHGAPTQALLDYARAGGNVVVQYQTPEFTAADAPYPLDLGSNEKVVDETAPVHLTPSNGHTLTTPNAITSADFNGWIEERGHGFLSTWDPHYSAPTETHDPGQAPQKGGLITTSLGQGHWTYCAFALYRQLPEAVPGAYRLFLNLLTP